MHRSQYEAAQTAQYENARHLVKILINAEDEKAVIWTLGTTHSINLVANGLLPSLHTDDEILISQADHHANFVTWHEIAKKWTMPLRNWGIVLGELEIMYLDRLS